MGTILQDLKYGLRMLAKNPGFTAVAILSLALGMGASTTIFSFVHGMLLRPLPYRDPDRLVFVWERVLKFGLERNTPAPGNFVDWKNQNRVFEDMAAFFFWQITDYTLTGLGEPERLQGAQVTANLFPLLGVEPSAGRNFLPEEDRDGRRKVVLLSDALWRRRLNSDPGIIGRAIELNATSYTVIGVMPPRFGFPIQQVDVWIPLSLTAAQMTEHGSHYLEVLARLKPGVTLPQASSEMETIAHRLEAQYPASNTGVGATVVPMKEQFSSEARPALLVLLAAVGFVLSIACANVANLLIARGAARQREIAVRMALGAGKARLVRQLLTESVTISAAGGALGLLLASWGIDLLHFLVPANLWISRAGTPTPVTGGIDGGVLLFSLLLSVGTGLVFGLAPAFSASQLNLQSSLKEGIRGTSSGAPRARLRNVLVVFEVAMALLLLIGTGLMVKSFARLTGVDPGFDSHNVIALSIKVAGPRYQQPEQRFAAFKEILRRVEGVSGVESAGLINILPMTVKGGSSAFFVEGQPLPLPGKETLANNRRVSPDYFHAMRIPLIKGRFFSDRDTSTAPPVAIVNETMARRYFNSDAIGKRFKVGAANSPAPWIQVVGVTGDVRQYALNIEPNPEMYFPYEQNNFTPLRSLVVRTTVDPASLVPALRKEIRAVEPNEPVDEVRPLNELVGESVALQRLETVLWAAFSLLAVALASVGLYGVLSYLVTQRRHEIGIRMALGAQQRDVLKLVVRQGMVLTSIGVAIGLAGAFAGTRVLSSLLYGIRPTDPATFVAVSLVLAAVAMLASYIPARRATKVDPMVTLRYE